MVERYADAKAERKELRRKSILDAAESLFGEKDYHIATVDEIAERASIKKGTVYLYFDSKLDLFLSTVERKLRQLKTALRDTIAASPDPAEAIRLIIRTELRFLEDNLDFFQVMHTQVGNFLCGPDCEIFRERLFPTFRSLADLFAETIENGQRKGIFQDMDSTQAAHDLGALIRNALFMSQLGLEGSPLSDKAEHIERLFLEGLLTRK